MKIKKTLLLKNIFIYCMICSISIVLIQCEKETDTVEETEKPEEVQKHNPEEYAGLWGNTGEFNFEITKEGYLEELYLFINSSAGCTELFSFHGSQLIRNDKFDITIKWTDDKNVTMDLSCTFFSTDSVNCTFGGYTGYISTYTCGSKIYTGNISLFSNGHCSTKKNFIRISMFNPYNYQTVSGDTIKISPIIESTYDLSIVEFFINDVLVFTDNSWPFFFLWSTKEFNNGLYDLKIIAYDEFNNSDEFQVTVTLNKNDAD